MPVDPTQEQASSTTTERAGPPHEGRSTNGATPSMLAREALQQALSRCMATHPPEGLEYRMHPDANRMADLWAAMLVERIDSVPVDGVDHRVIEAFERWR